MPVMLRLPHLSTVLMLAATTCVAAESPMPDPIAPAVIGRPLEQIRPARVAQKPAAIPTATGTASDTATGSATADKPRQAAVARKPVAAPAPRVAAAPSARVAPAPAAPVAASPGPLALAPAPALAAPTAAPQAQPGQRAAKQAVDDRPDTRAMGAQAAVDVGQGTHFARKPLAPGVYFGPKHQELVRKYYESHPASGKTPPWKIGEPVPSKAPLAGVPDELRATLPPLPRGHQYVQLGGEVVLVAVQSRMVVDGISRKAR